MTLETRNWYLVYDHLYCHGSESHNGAVHTCNVIRYRGSVVTNTDPVDFIFMMDPMERSEEEYHKMCSLNKNLLFELINQIELTPEQVAKHEPYLEELYNKI